MGQFYESRQRNTMDGVFLLASVSQMHQKCGRRSARHKTLVDKKFLVRTVALTVTLKTKKSENDSLCNGLS